MMPMFEHDYVWLNKGEWRAHSSEEAAISTARGAANRAGKFNEVMDADRITIDKLACDDASHKGNLCNHLRIRFWTKKGKP